MAESSVLQSIEQDANAGKTFQDRTVNKHGLPTPEGTPVPESGHTGAAQAPGLPPVPEEAAQSKAPVEEDDEDLANPASGEDARKEAKKAATIKHGLEKQDKAEKGITTMDSRAERIRTDRHKKLFGKLQNVVALCWNDPRESLYSMLAESIQDINKFTEIENWKIEFPPNKFKIDSDRLISHPYTVVKVLEKSAE